jgi:hypothetical protein
LAKTKSTKQKNNDINHIKVSETEIHENPAVSSKHFSIQPNQFNHNKVQAVCSSGPSEHLSISRRRGAKEDQLIKPFSIHLYKD